MCFSVEQRMRLLGATYVKAEKPWDVSTVSAFFLTFR